MDEFYLAPKVAPGEVVPIPSGLKMYGDRFYWTCDDGLGTDVKAPRKHVPFDCSPWPGSHVAARVSLPSCWDGIRLDSVDHRSHMAYAARLTGCPSDHPVVLPSLYLSVSWYLTDGTGATLSTGDVSTLRGIFFDAWDPAEMARLVNTCIDQDVWCGGPPPGQNRPPVIKAAKVIPCPVHQTDTAIAIAINPHDPDGDPFMLHYRWEDDGAVVGSDADSLDHLDFSVGDVLTVTISAVDDHGNWSIPVTSPGTIARYDVVVPATGRPGGLLRHVHGGGFGPNENVELHLDHPDGLLLATVATDVQGMFRSVDVWLPRDISIGLHRLYGLGERSGIVGDGPFSIEPRVPLVRT
jgi:hypothetical protein